MHTKYGKLTIASTALSAVLMFAAPAAQADDRADCQRHLEKAEQKFDQAVSRHGERSKQASEARQRLNAERQTCFGRNHAWYDAHERRWHTEQDWDHDRDHDRDHDHDDHH